MSETGMKWYVLRAVSGKEGKVKEFIEAAKKHNDILEAHVGEVLLPTEKYAMLRNGKRVIKEKMFLPGYVLVQANLQGEGAAGSPHKKTSTTSPRILTSTTRRTVMTLIGSRN